MARFYQLILESVNTVATQKVLNLCRSNRKFIAQMLNSVNEAE